MNKVIYIILLVFSSQSYANFVIQFCAPTKESNIKLTKTLKFLRIDKDKVNFLNNCWFVQTQLNRISLYETFVQKNHPEVTVITETNNQKCLYEIEEEEFLKASKLSLSPTLKNDTRVKITKTNLQALANTEVSSQISGLQIDLKCNPRSSGIINVEIKISGPSRATTTQMNMTPNTRTLVAQTSKTDKGQDFNINLNNIQFHETKKTLHSNIYHSKTS